MSQLEDIKARVAGHTPGPWGVHADTHEYRGGDFMQVEPKVGARTICEVTDQHKANAELIAAAPKLIAALEAVEALAEQWRYKGEFGWGAWQEGHGPDQEGWVLDQAASEIRKAITEALL